MGIVTDYTCGLCVTSKDTVQIWKIANKDELPIAQQMSYPAPII